MKIFVINLERRPDRLAAMAAETAKRGLSFTRVAALDGESAKAREAESWFAHAGPLGVLSCNEKCCLISHRAAWTALVESGEPHAVILEDDVRLGEAAAGLLADDGWISPDIDCVKLEHFGPPGQHVLLAGERALRDHGVVLGRMASRHTGAAAYVLSRRAALHLLGLTRFDQPVDHLLFNPNISPVFAALQPWQMVPPLARQHDFVGTRSDLEPARRPLRKFSLAYAQREATRFWHDLKLIPRQVGLVLTGRARLVAIGKTRPAPAAQSATKSKPQAAE